MNGIYENWFAIVVLTLWVVTIALVVGYELHCEKMFDEQKRRSRNRLNGSEWNNWKESQGMKNIDVPVEKVSSTKHK